MRPIARVHREIEVERQRPNAYSNLMCMIVQCAMWPVARERIVWHATKKEPIAIIFIIPICSIVCLCCSVNGQSVNCEQRIRLNCAYLFKIVESMSLYVDMAGLSQCISDRSRAPVHWHRAFEGMKE